MGPPDESQDTAEPPNVFRQALVFYIAALFAMVLSLALASVLASVLDIPTVLFMWLFILVAIIN